MNKSSKYWQLRGWKWLSCGILLRNLIAYQNCCWLILCWTNGLIPRLVSALYITYYYYEADDFVCSCCSVEVTLYTVKPYSRCMYSCACGQHLCMCGWQRKYMEINASSCSLYTSNAALLLARQRSDKARARGSKANETAIAQTHPADPWILIQLRKEMEAGCLHSLNSSPIN